MKPQRPALLLLATCLAAACQGGPVTPDPRRSVKPSEAVRAAATPGPSSAPGTPEPTGAPTTPPARLLRKPGSGTITLRGSVKIDASYLVDAGAGSVIAKGGSLFAAAGKGLVLANNGSSLLGNNGGALVANNSGNIISDKGAGIISDKGAGIISDKGAGYALAQAAALPEFGAQLPAAGMRLRVVSLLDGKDLPLGVDDAGKPVTEIYTNMAGGWEVHVPEALAGTLRVVAEAPDTADRRLSYALFAHTASQQATSLDEDTAAMARYLRSGVTARFLGVLRGARTARAKGEVKDADLVPLFFPDAGDVVPAEVLTLVGELLGQVIAEAETNAKIGPDDDAELAKRLADVVFGRGPDPATIEFGLGNYTFDKREEIIANPYHKGNALANMTAIMREVRLKVVELGKGKTPAQVEALFAAKPYILTANRLRAPGLPPYRVRKASDLMDFIAEEYVPLVRGQRYGDLVELTNGDIHDLSKAVLTDIGLPASHIDVIYGAGGTIAQALAPVALETETRAALLAVVRGWDR